MNDAVKDFAADIAAIADIDAVPKILDIVCRTTGMGFAAIARVTEDRWIACETRDTIGFGLQAGGELPVETTICSAIRKAREPVVIDAVADDPVYRGHPIPALYGFQSYLSVPIILKDGTFFGTLCAIDTKPAKVDTPEIVGTFQLFAELIAAQLQTNHRFNASVRRHEEAEERLRQSQKMEAVGQLTGGLAHDFNNLLTGIGGSLDLMRLRLSQGRTHDIERYIVAAQGASKRAAGLTQRLLAFSRRQTLLPEVTDVDRLVTGMAELITGSISARIHFEVAGAADLWPARVDQNQLENALLNLCINARDAMPDGGRLTVETGNHRLDAEAAAENDLEPGHYVSLSVSDTGSGMSPAVIARAFDPFFTTKPIGVGTGLGLSMVYGFARQSGGHVRIRSVVDQGTTVCIYLPRHRSEIDKDSDEDSDGVSVGQMPVIPAEVAGVVLVVDDEPTVRMLLTDLLHEMGYGTIEAGDGNAALKWLMSDRAIALLITDVGLPGSINGRQLASAARSTRPDLKILFVTGYAENAVINQGHLEAGMQMVLKPFVVESLGIRIKHFIES